MLPNVFKFSWEKNKVICVVENFQLYVVENFQLYKQERQIYDGIEKYSVWLTNVTLWKKRYFIRLTNPPHSQLTPWSPEELHTLLWQHFLIPIANDIPISHLITSTPFFKHPNSTNNHQKSSLVIVLCS